MALIEPSVVRSIAEASGVEGLDAFAASTIAMEVETRLRQIVGESLDVQRHTKGVQLEGSHVAAALSRHSLPVSWSWPRCLPLPAH
jgi:hypothetical protein